MESYLNLLAYSFWLSYDDIKPKKYFFKITFPRFYIILQISFNFLDILFFCQQLMIGISSPETSARRFLLMRFLFKLLVHMGYYFEWNVRTMCNKLPRLYYFKNVVKIKTNVSTKWDHPSQWAQKRRGDVPNGRHRDVPGTWKVKSIPSRPLWTSIMDVIWTSCGRLFSLWTSYGRTLDVHFKSYNVCLATYDWNFYYPTYF